ncbi:SAM-dependent methyltransferase [Actinomycetospora soli]|uniref:SAM-dependent methyltransferase n=1 Tax=Actinomycetospora soli TaxID=2893887 RepID=UPI001E560AB1|nr:SAM-dependent methyltransferase [Actinomycetospora soli]MCD2191565.1 SAM-dependent methyltransferase [Actinomycetospora soli]
MEAGIDFERPNAARLYDYYLGGAHNFASDRELGEQVVKVMPEVRAWARANRAFLARVVRYCVAQGVRQFLDLGSGIPTVNHVHDVARELAPDTRVAYVDFEPVAVAHSQQLLAHVEGVSITRADARDPASVLSAPTVNELLDFREPVAVLAVALMHFVSDDDDPVKMIEGYRRVLVPGSFLAISQVSDDYDDPDLTAHVRALVELYRGSATPAFLRDRTQIRALFGELELVDPGLVDVNHWHNDVPDPPQLSNYAGLARIL